MKSAMTACALAIGLTIIGLSISNTPISTAPRSVQAAEPAGAGDVLLPSKTGAESPPPRSRAEVDDVLKGAPATPPKTRPIHIVLVAGKKDHGQGEHDYPAWQKVWAKLLAQAKDVTVSTAWETPSEQDFKNADVMMFFKHAAYPASANDAMDAFFARGGGAVYMHYAVDGANLIPHIGLTWGPGAKYRHGWLDLKIDTARPHPITRNFSTVRFHDETYWNLPGNSAGVNVLATATEDGKPQPIFWTKQVGKGRTFVCILGHYNWTFNDPLFRVLLLRGTAWTAGEPVDRFNALVTRGVTLRDGDSAANSVNGK